MKKKILTATTLVTVALFAAACGSQTGDAPQTADVEESTADTAETEETNVGMANPWRDCTEEEATQYTVNGFKAPEGATNVRWSLMEAADPNTLPGTMVQLTYDLDNAEITAREQAVSGEEITDISGAYYDWTVSNEGTLANWAGGYMPFKSYRYVGDNEYVDLILWFDIETGYAYSVCAQAPDLDGFDIQAVAEQMYDPEKQEWASIPDDESEENPEYTGEAIEGYAEDVAPSIDISGCDTFTQIVDKKLEDGMGYANASLLDTDVLLVSSGVFDDLEGGYNAIDAAVFEYKDGVPFEVGKICSGGTAYPISVNNGYLYTGSNHWICKYAMADDKLMIMERASVEYDTDGNGTYHYESEDGGDYSSIDSAEAEKIFDDLMSEMFDGEIVAFNKVSR